MTVFTGTANTDNFVGAADVADTFNFSFANLSGSDTVDGGAGSGDILRLTSAGTVTAALLANKSGLEQINLSAAGNDLTLDTVFLAANGGRFTIQGNDIGNAVSIFSTGPMVVTYRAFGGGDTVTGGQGREIIEASAAIFGDLGEGDDILRLGNIAASGGTLRGGIGDDRLEILAGGAWNVASYAGFEEVILSKATTLTMAAEVGQSLEGSVARDVITLGAAGQTVHADLGDDEVRVTSTTLAGAFLNGGGQVNRDVLVLEGGGNFNLRSGAIVTGFERVVVGDGSGNTSSTVIFGANQTDIVLRNGGSFNLSNNAATVVQGSRFTDTVFLGASGQVVDMGGGADLVGVTVIHLMGGAMISGGRGYDRIGLLSGGVLDMTQSGTVVGVEALNLNYATTLIGNDSITEIQGSSVADDISSRARFAQIFGNAGADIFRVWGQGQAMIGGTGADIFEIRAASLGSLGNQALGFIGGNAVNDIFDTENDVLVLGNGAEGAGFFELDLAPYEVGGIDRINFNLTSYSQGVLRLDDQVVGFADGDRDGLRGDLWITGLSSSGDTLIDGSLVTGSRRLVVNVGSSGFSGKDTMLGGAGNDFFNGAAGNDLLNGGGGADTLRGFDGDDTLLGGAGNDSLFGDAGRDSYTGGAGGDILDLATSFTESINTVIYTSANDGTADLDPGIVTEAQADKIMFFDPARDFFVFDRSDLGLNAGGVTRVAANGAWNPSSAAVFLFESDTGSADTILADNFVSMADLFTFNADNFSVTGSAPGSTAILFISNAETSAVRRTGIYHWIDDGDGLLEGGDTIRLLGIVQGVTANQIVNVQIFD
ncbi:beta strand repeat-containing protein [Stagnihabitans tardus]|uniref:Calcium-binding protein n=1 Tax=Stagnihabitans tardus TaxID=2699202 RepID=A0AAE5BV89_9RHOB|nr:hypothetical protein [Stagnihabitans tardus]NBZ86988.1 hypothetical protein [Stagnihabitans tardus]